MAKEKTTDIVLGTRECGCICSILALGISTAAEDRKSIAEIVGMGLIAKRVTMEAYRAMLPFRTCPDCAERRKSKRDNRSINLEWCNRSENMIHAYRRGLRVRPVGALNGRSKARLAPTLSESGVRA